VSPILVADPDDPNPPADVAAYSDYTTPTSVTLTWTDPTTYADGTPLGDFSIDVLRDDVFVTNVDQGNGTFVDGGRTDGQEYEYALITHDDVTDSLSVPVRVSVFAGGDPMPAPPTALSCTSDTLSATIFWTNPTTQADGTPLDDFAGVRLYRNGSFLIELARSQGDTGSADSYTDFPPTGFTYQYEVSAIDNEAPVNESARGDAGVCFVGDVPKILVWQPSDVPGTSGSTIYQTLVSLGESVIFTDNLYEFAPDLNVHEVVMAVIGIFSDNHIITADEGAALDDFVQDGGRLYLEGGDCFNYDPESSGGYNIRPIFGLDDGPDGSGDLGGVIGLNDLAGFSFVYGGANAWIDELQPLTSVAVLQNDSNTDIVGVFEPAYGSGRSIGCSFEFGGLQDAIPSRLAVPAFDLSRWIRSAGYQGAPISDAFKHAPEAEEETAPVRRLMAANTQTADRPAPARFQGGFGSALAALTMANTKEDLMAAYLMLLRATGDPVMVVAPDALASTVWQDSTDTQFVTVSNPGSLNDDLTFTVTESPAVGWLSVAPTGGTVPNNSQTVLTVDFDAATLAPGLYATELIVAGNDPANPSDTVSVTLQVNGIPTIEVMPESLYFAVAPLDSADGSVKIYNTGVGDLDYELSVAGGAGADRAEFAATNGTWSGAGRYRGNVYQVDVAVPLKSIEHLLNITSPTELEFFVYEGTAAVGSFTKIFSLVTTSGTGSGWHGSGPIEVDLEVGKYYFIGTGWLGDVTYYDDNGTLSTPVEVPFGYLVGPGGKNAYPPPTSETVYFGSVVHSQAIEFGAPADVELLSSPTGTLTAGDSTVVDLRVIGGEETGTFASVLRIDSNDPNTGRVNVPLTIDVLDLTGVASEEAALPLAVALHQSTPNPFASRTTIRYDLPATDEVSIRIYDVTGRLVRVLVDGAQAPGQRAAEWDGLDDAGRRVASGIYFYTLRTGNEMIRRKLVFMR
jgi:hypothetical protein